MPRCLPAPRIEPWNLGPLTQHRARLDERKAVNGHQPPHFMSGRHIQNIEYLLVWSFDILPAPCVPIVPTFTPFYSPWAGRPNRPSAQMRPRIVPSLEPPHPPRTVSRALHGVLLCFFLLLLKLDPCFLLAVTSPGPSPSSQLGRRIHLRLAASASWRLLSRITAL